MRFFPVQFIAAGLMMVMAVASAVGQQNTASTSKDSNGHDHGHGHHHEAPHGGTLIAFGEEFAHLELVLDSKTGDLTGYALDGEAQKAVRLTQPEIGLQLYSRDLDTTVTAKLKASENALTGEKAGDTSQFEANVPALKGKTHFKVIVEQISIRGSEFKNTRAKFPEGNH